MGFGPATVMEPAFDPEVDAICDSFLRRIEYTGICEIEMKRDTRDGRVKLIEANPRLSGSGDAAPYSGVDICWLHYLDLIGRPVCPVSPRENYFKHVVLRSDARAIPQYLSARAITWRDLWNSYRGPLAFYDIDWRDWRYSVETIWLSARAFLWRMLRSLFGYRIYS
jgi:predicted ATP-grasp superfamily ATP-dependent carboligase